MDFASSLVSANKRKKNRSSYYDPLPNESPTTTDPTGYASQDVPAPDSALVPKAPTGPTPLNFNPTADAGISKDLPYADPNKGLSQSLLRANAIDDIFSGGDTDVYAYNGDATKGIPGVTYTGPEAARAAGATPGHPQVAENVFSAANDPTDIASQLTSHLASVLGESVARNATKKKNENLGGQDLTDPAVRARLRAAGYALPQYGQD